MHTHRPSVAGISGRPNSAADMRYRPTIDLLGAARAMRDWFSQIVIGVIVTVIGTVIAHAIISGKGGRYFFGGGHYSGSSKSGR